MLEFYGVFYLSQQDSQYNIFLLQINFKSQYILSLIFYFSMKYLTSTTNTTNNTTTQVQQSQGQQGDSLQLCQNHLSQKQLNDAIEIIRKVREINKTKITKMKKKNKGLNELFSVMSEFFFTRKKKTLETRKNQKNRRIQLRSKALLAKMRKIHQHKYTVSSFNQANPQQQTPSIPQDKNEQIQPSDQYLPIKNSTCYICSKVYSQIDDIYHQHCPKCSAFSKEKRLQTANFIGKTALVTGARIKIGFQIVLKLLRDGALVYATTRFVKDALFRYQKQADYSQFKQRLFLIQCDLLSSQQVNSLIKYIKQKVHHLDILIHNAAQTIARPPQFYTIQLQNQMKQIANQQIVSFQSVTHPSIQMYKTNAILPEESNSSICLNKTDEFGQPIDLRIKNTWKQKIQDVSLVDCLSTQVINSTMPFYITGQLRCIMGGDIPSWVVNVSSMQGVFYRKNKTCFHPHTNMAKASLNMMTRTCGEQMSKKNIYMTSVDTGWVTNQNPYEYMVNMENKHQFVPPLDCIEGAMRVLDPIYLGVNKKKFPYGVFFKNYQQYYW